MAIAAHSAAQDSFDRDVWLAPTRLVPLMKPVCGPTNSLNTRGTQKSVAFIVHGSGGLAVFGGPVVVGLIAVVVGASVVAAMVDGVTGVGLAVVVGIAVVVFGLVVGSTVVVRGAVVVGSAVVVVAVKVDVTDVVVVMVVVVVTVVVVLHGTAQGGGMPVAPKSYFTNAWYFCCCGVAVRKVMRDTDFRLHRVFAWNQ